MWLLEANMDVHLLALVREIGVECAAATRRAWATLEKGALVAAAASGGFTCLLTRDRLFGESAAESLKAFPSFAVVAVQLPQRPWREYLRQFRRAWEGAPIRPMRGLIVDWPERG